MRIHIIGEDDEFPPIVDVSEDEWLYGDEILCFDSPLLYNFAVGDQVQSRFYEVLLIYIVMEVRPASELVSYGTIERLHGPYSGDRLRVVTLRNVI